MLIRFTKFYPNVPFKSNPGSIINPKGEIWSFKVEASNVIHQLLAEAGDKVKGPGKEKQISLKMPGFVHPETIKEEGYFTQKSKQQLEELKKKRDGNPTMTNPEKKN